MLVRVDGLALGATAIVDLGNRKAALDRIVEVHRLVEFETHPRRQPPKLSADFGHEARGKKTVADEPREVFLLRVTAVIVDRIEIAADVAECSGILGSEAAGDGEGIAGSETGDGFMANR